MVNYPTWTRIAFEIARDDVSQQRVISAAAQGWNQNKRQIEAMNENQARELAKRIL